MKIYETTTLADYVSANWMDLDPALVRMFERTINELEFLQADVDAWRDNYESAVDTCRDIKRDLESIIYRYTHETFDATVGEVIDDIRDAIDDNNLDFV